MKYYRVEAKCGHVGRNNYIVKTFYVYGEDGKDAAAYVRALPRVKHNHKDAIQDVCEISFDEYVAGKTKNHNDPFFSVDNKQDQSRYCNYIYDCLEKEDEEIKYKKNSKHKKQHLIDLIILKEWKTERNMIYE